MKDLIYRATLRAVTEFRSRTRQPFASQFLPHINRNGVVPRLG